MYGTKALMSSAEKQALCTNCTKFHIDKTAESLIGRICGEKKERRYGMLLDICIY